MGILIQDLRYGLRMLTKNPGFTAVAVLALAVGIAVNTAIFTAYNAALRPIQATDPHRGQLAVQCRRDIRAYHIRRNIQSKWFCGIPS